MICINCFHTTSRVTNSRPNKKTARIWRRRQCEKCQKIFSTEEHPRFDENQKIYNSTKQTREAFNLGILIISISRAFTHNPEEGRRYALDLAESVQYLLLTQYGGGITNDDISAVTHTVLRRYDEVAGLQYAAQHNMLVMKRRRGRPSVTEA